MMREYRKMKWINFNITASSVAEGRTTVGEILHQQKFTFIQWIEWWLNCNKCGNFLKSVLTYAHLLYQFSDICPFLDVSFLINIIQKSMVKLVISKQKILNLIVLQIYLWNGTRLLERIQTTGLVISILHQSFSPPSITLYFVLLQISDIPWIFS